MPESVKDRPTRSHEYIFMLTKSKKNFYDYKAVVKINGDGKPRNRRTVWDVNTQPFAERILPLFPLP